MFSNICDRYGTRKLIFKISTYLLLDFNLKTMKALYTQEQYDKSKANDVLPCECYECKNVFYPQKKQITRSLIKQPKWTPRFCSRDCKSKYNTKSQKVSCKNCGEEFEKMLKEIKKSNNHFCSQSCSTTYNNKNKTHGTKRSKLEAWLEEKLISLYPNTEIHFNQKAAINSELDIYIPSLNLAFELNGIFHYEPIYGTNKLHQIQENDVSKSKACHEAKIDLCTIDTSGQKYFKESTSQKYLDIINNIIKERI